MADPCQRLFSGFQPQVVCVRWGSALGASDDFRFELCVVLCNNVARLNGIVFPARPDVGSEDPLNLSISLSVGTETKSDPPSNGE